MNIKIKRTNRIKRHKRIRAIVKGTNNRPRLSVFRSNKHIYAQLIDDIKGVTLLAANDASKTKAKGTKDKKADSAFKAGEVLAKKALEKGIDSVIFDRGGYKYHGRVKALAEGARKGGLKF
jgi:large subunit ribosomal protein L18